MQNSIANSKNLKLCTKILKFLEIFVCTITTVEIILGNVRPYNTLSFIFLLAVCCLLYASPDSRDTHMYCGSKIVALLFTLSVVLTKNWLTTQFSNIIHLAILCFGTFIIVRKISNCIYICIYAASKSKKNVVSCRSVKSVFWVSFFLLWLVYVIFFLNQYPGALPPDDCAQLMQVLRIIPFDNENPLVSTLFIGFWVKIGVLFSGHINDGVGLYTFAQLTMTAMIFAYTVCIIYKHTGSMKTAAIVHAFYNFMPYNIVFAASMWKDTFFAVSFLLTMAYICDFVLSAKDNNKNYVIIFLLVLITSLTRNSGWSSLLVFGAAVLIYLAKHPAEKFYIKCKKLAGTVIAGAVSSLLIVAFVYPLWGVTDNGSIVVGLSTPLQQVARVVAQGEELSTRDYHLIDAALTFDVEEIPECYEESISDPIKFAVKVDVLESNLWEYMKMWVRLGLKHPKIYLDAYVGLMKGFWSFESSDWLWDTRIWENDIGVTRESKLLPWYDLAHSLRILTRIPNAYVLQNSAIILWTTILMFGYARSKNNIIAELLLIPTFMIYIGLFATAPAASFRYIYAAAVCCPLNCMIAFAKEK